MERIKKTIKRFLRWRGRCFYCLKKMGRNNHSRGWCPKCHQRQGGI